MKQTIKNNIHNFIINNYDYNQTFTLKDLYEKLPYIKRTTIREMIRRLYEENKVLRVKPGVYQYPNPDRVLKRPAPNISDTLKRKYIKGKYNKIEGYISGINVANMLGLTSQTASVETIISNLVSNKKREVKINNNRFIVNAPRTPVTTSNYKLLQVMDLLTKFDQYSEYSLEDVKRPLISYLSDLQIDSSEIERIASNYPLQTQVRFYKSGVYHAITQK